MINRSKHLPIYILLIGIILFSVGINIVFYNRILILQDFMVGANPWVDLEQFHSMKQEIQRLQNDKYKILPN
jgi:hypothetical protein